MASKATTFKQFLEDSDALKMLPYELFFRTEMHLSKEAAKAAVRWAYLQGRTDEPPVISIPDDGWHHITDWVDAKYREEKGVSVYDVLGKRNNLSMPMVAKAYIAKVMREKYKLELMNAPIVEGQNSPLIELAFVLGIRQELGCSKEQAEELVAWLAGEKDWEDLEHDARGVMMEKYGDPDVVKDKKHPGLSYEDYVMDELAGALRISHKLDARTLR